jgi:hypothetical protein
MPSVCTYTNVFLARTKTDRRLLFMFCILELIHSRFVIAESEHLISKIWSTSDGPQIIKWQFSQKPTI